MQYLIFADLKNLLSFFGSTKFFQDNCNLQVRNNNIQLETTVDEEGMTHLEAHIEFRSIQELKLARKLNGHLMGNSRVFFDRTLGRYLTFYSSILSFETFRYIYRT